MGNWTVKAWGVGPHHNAHNPTTDADEQAKRFCEALRLAGQVLGGCEFTHEVDGKQTMEVIARPAAREVPIVPVGAAPPAAAPGTTHEPTHVVSRATMEAEEAQAHGRNDRNDHTDRGNDHTDRNDRTDRTDHPEPNQPSQQPLPKQNPNPRR